MAKEVLKPRRVKSRDDRNAGRGSFITLKKKGDQFLGYALFKPDPELSDNPGYFEYLEHYTPATGYMPCAGDKCPLCDEGDNPSVRAKTLWLVDNELKVFTLNYYMVEDFDDLLQEGDNAILGQQFRITRLAGQGKYGIRPKAAKLTKADLKKALKDVDDDYLEKLAQKQMKRVLDEMDAADAMEEDDDDTPDEDDDDKNKSKSKSGSKSRKGKPADDDDDGDGEESESEASFDPDDDDEAEEITVSVVKVKDKKNNVLTVEYGDNKFDLYGTDDIDLTEFSKGDEITVSFEKDDDGDFVVSEASEAEEGDGEDESEGEESEGPDSYEDAVVEIVAVNSDEDTLTVKDEDDNEFDLYFLDSGDDDNGKDWAELDLADYEEGQKVTINAARDDDGDMLASTFPEAVKKSGSKKSGKKSGKKK